MRHHTSACGVLSDHLVDAGQFADFVPIVVADIGVASLAGIRRSRIGTERLHELGSVVQIGIQIVVEVGAVAVQA